MKTSFRIFLQKIGLSMLTLMMGFIAFAQDKQVDISTKTTTTSTSEPVVQPWMYVLGAAIFVLLLIALLKNNKKS